MLILIVGLVVGVLTGIDFSFLNLAEIAIIAHLMFIVFKARHLIVAKSTKFFWIFSILFIVLTVVRLFFKDVNSELVLKNIFKYSDILLLTYYFYTLFIVNKAKSLNYVIGICFGNIVTIYLKTFHLGLSYFLHYSFFVIVMMFLLIKFNKKTLYIYIYIIGFILAIIGHSRNALLVIFLTIVYDLLAFSVSEIKSKKEIIIKFGVMILALMLIIFGKNFITNNLSEQTQSNTERFYLINTAFREFRDNFFFGVGPGNFNFYARFRYGLRFASTDLSTHNQFLELACEWGITGFIIYVVPYVYLFINMFDYKKNKDNKKIYITLFCMMFFNVISGDSRILLSILQAYCLYDFSLKES